MPQYRRSRALGATYFFTVVTYRRQRILTQPYCIEILRQVIRTVKHMYPFTINAWVLLPEHMHCIWTLPPGDGDYSKRWGMIKAGFSKHIKRRLHHHAWASKSRQKHRESIIWQRRFWEHQIRDEGDYQRHLDYLHYNPVKHGLVKTAWEWPYSTFHRYVDEGMYSPQWGADEMIFDEDYGE